MASFGGRCCWEVAVDGANLTRCVILEIPLGRRIRAKYIRAEVSPQALRIFVMGDKVFEDFFAERGWLQLDESYWELDLKAGWGPKLTYFLVINQDSQLEEMEFLFVSERRARHADDSHH